MVVTTLRGCWGLKRSMREANVAVLKVGSLPMPMSKTAGRVRRVQCYGAL